jgi:hypothetical protein
MAFLPADSNAYFVLAIASLLARLVAFHVSSNLFSNAISKMVPLLAQICNDVPWGRILGCGWIY